MGVSNEVMTNVWPVEGWGRDFPGKLDVYRETSLQPYKRELCGHSIRVCQDGPQDAFAAVFIDVPEDGSGGADFKAVWSARQEFRHLFAPCVVVRIPAKGA